MTDEQLKQKLIAKFEQEFSNYKEDLIKNKSKEEIIKSAYEITFKEQIVDIISNSNYSEDEIKALLKTDNALENLYKHYLYSDGNVWGKLEDNVDEKVTKITIYYLQNKLKNRKKER